MWRHTYSTRGDGVFYQQLFKLTVTIFNIVRAAAASVSTTVPTRNGFGTASFQRSLVRRTPRELRSSCPNHPSIETHTNCDCTLLETAKTPACGRCLNSYVFQLLHKELQILFQCLKPFCFGSKWPRRADKWLSVLKHVPILVVGALLSLPFLHGDHL